MDELYYDMIFKRKSFHIFSGVSRLSDEEIKEILCHIQKLQPLVNGINPEFRIVPRAQTSCKRGEYCILIYSEMKEHYLHNVGYMAEQLDLWLAAKNIGACWYGMGKTSEMKYNGLDFVIMIAIEKVEEDFKKLFPNLPAAERDPGMARIGFRCDQRNKHRKSFAARPAGLDFRSFECYFIR